MISWHLFLEVPALHFYDLYDLKIVMLFQHLKTISEIVPEEIFSAPGEYKILVVTKI